MPIYRTTKPEARLTDGQAFLSIRIYGILLLSLLSLNVSAQQEVVEPLQNNPVLQQYYPQYLKQKQQEKIRSKHGEIHTLYLPFFEDFSNSYIYPNDTVWLNKYVYINKTMAINPPSTGVATFDGLNLLGQPYLPGSLSTNAQPTDSLTSTYIDLSPFQDKDSIYMSFYYQPGGSGDAPEAKDSFVLQFKPDSLLMSNGKWDTTAWLNVWSVGGSASHPFKLVMVPVKNRQNGRFLHEKFQFRFISYGNQSGQIDHWHLDYIYMNQGRSVQDTLNNLDIVLKDAAVYRPSTSILKKYSEMTVKQFLAGNSLLIGDIPIFTTNNSNQVKNVAFGYKIVDKESGALITSFLNAQGENINPGEHRRLDMTNKLTPAALNGKTRATLDIYTSVTSIPDDFRENDTAFHRQYFADCLAYDDGTAEGAYGITGTQVGKVALRFTLNTPDTLYGFAIHFTQAEEYVGGNFINLAVWKHLTAPGTPEKDQPDANINFVRPVYEKRVNGFHYFELAQPLPVTDEFYIGWTQSRDFNLKVGYDKNYQDVEGNTSNVFLSLTGKWEQSKLKGTPMIRAYLSQRPIFLGTEKQVKSASVDVPIINLFPNPNKGIFNIEFSKAANYNAQVFDIAGKQLFSTDINTASQVLDLKHFSKGLYMVKVTDKNTGAFVVKRLVIQ